MKYLTMLICLFITSCGYTSVNNEAVGQVKKIMHNTPLVCPDYHDVDISLGVLRNGTGSVSAQDWWYSINDKEVEDILKKAQDNGKLVRIHYNVKRFTWCVWDHQITSVEIME